MQNRSSIGRQTRFITLSVKGAPVQGSRGRGLSLLLLAVAHAPWPAAARGSPGAPHHRLCRPRSCAEFTARPPNTETPHVSRGSMRRGFTWTQPVQLTHTKKNKYSAPGIYKAHLLCPLPLMTTKSGNYHWTVRKNSISC